jgi:hypothetical protein
MLTYLSTRRRDSGLSSAKKIRKSSRLRRLSYGRGPSSPCLLHPPNALLTCVRVCVCGGGAGIEPAMHDSANQHHPIVSNERAATDSCMQLPSHQQAGARRLEELRRNGSPRRCVRDAKRGHVLGLFVRLLPGRPVLELAEI